MVVYTLDESNLQELLSKTTDKLLQIRDEIALTKISKMTNGTFARYPTYVQNLGESLIYIEHTITDILHEIKDIMGSNDEIKL